VSIAVKAWISIGLILLAGYTAYTLIRITNDRRARPIASNPVTPVGSELAKPLPLESFEMTGQDGELFGFEKLRGQVWIASLFFSSCPHECKSLNQTIAALQRDPEFDDVQFVSMSVDPAVDDPQTLSEYAKLFDADQNQWLFLTGDLQEVGRFGREINVPAGYKTHTRRLVLFDRAGKPRGHFRYNDAADIAALKALLPELLAESSAGGEEEKETSADTGRRESSPAEGRGNAG